MTVHGKTNPDKQIRSIRLLLTILLTGISTGVFAQLPTDSLPKDPSKISVYAVQNLNFGSIYQGGSGGTVVISPTGSRSVTGSVVAINQGSPVFPAIFEVEGPAGIIITLQNGPDITLSGSNGGSMSLHLGSSYPVSPFVNTISPPGRTQVMIGGTLTVGSTVSSKPGNYSGTFSMIFFQQ